MTRERERKSAVEREESFRVDCAGHAANVRGVGSLGGGELEPSEE